jgi:hypothetical protein
MTPWLRTFFATALLTFGQAEEGFHLSLSPHNLLKHAEEIRPLPIYQYPHAAEGGLHYPSVHGAATIVITGAAVAGVASGLAARTAPTG